MTQMESPKRKMQKKNDYQHHKLFRKIKRRRKAQAEAEQHIAEKQLRRKLKLPKFDTGDDIKIVYLRDIVGHDPYTGQDILKTGERVNRCLPSVNVNQRDLSKVDAAERNWELRDLRKYMGDAAFEKYMSDLQIKKDIQNAQSQKAWQGEVADAIDVGMAALAFNPTTQPAADLYFALRTAAGNPDGAIGMIPIVGKCLPEIRNIAKLIRFIDNPNAQYLRYIGDELKYGFDASFPDLLPDMSQKHTTVSPIKSRFAYESGDVSPLISNFTTDYPVLPNVGGDWSTRPSDTFTFGENIKVPTKDIQVFNQNTNQVHDIGILNSKDLPEDLLDAFGNAQSREQLFNGHYKNVVYNPASPVESQFRKSVGIVTRNEIPINKRKFNSGKDIHIKKSKRGTFTKAAKQHGMSVQSFANRVLRNPSKYSAAMRKKANFAHNAASWKH